MSKRPHAALATPSPEDDDPIDPSDELEFVALGGGNEVGRSCHIIKYKGKAVMLDAGIHPAYDGLAALPFYDEFDLSTVDVLLITHFHMDHAASLPYVLAKTSFHGRVYMTHPTKAIYKHLMQDSVRVQNTHLSSSSSGSGTDGYINQLFNESDILSTLPLIQTISFNTTHTHNGIRFTPYPAGHVLGACMYLIEIAGLSILFTGDYSRENDRHLIPASVPKGLKIDCLITESTFGISHHVPRQEREAKLLKSITSILNRGGKCLMPVFAIGRAQELLLILEDYWTRHEEYRKYPIYYASSLARKCMVVYQTYIDSMNDNIRSKFQHASRHPSSATEEHGAANPAAGPWDFQFIRALKSLDRFDDVGGCVMLAAPGMLQNGVSRTLLERWAPDPKNGVVITGYSVEGTMAKTIMTEPDTIPAVMTARQQAQGVLLGKKAGLGPEDKMEVPRRCSVEEFSFAAHVDGNENFDFISDIDPEVVILVHGERHNMGRLRSRLLGVEKWKVYSPANCEEVRIPFRREKIARVVGRLANEITPPTTTTTEVGEGVAEEDGGRLVNGVLVQNDFKLSLMAPEDLKEYAGLTTTTILCRQRITLAAAGIDLIKWALESTFGVVTILPSSDKVAVHDADTDMNGHSVHSDDIITTLSILSSALRLEHHSRTGEILLEWEGNTTNDSIADAVMAVLLSVESSPAAVRQSSRLHSHSSTPHHHEDTTTTGEGGKKYDAFGDEIKTNGSTTTTTTVVSNGEADDGEEGKPSTKKPQRKNPFTAHLTPQEKLERFFMFLESQFGEDALSPIALPKLSSRPTHPPSSSSSGPSSAADDDDDDDTVAAQQKKELARLHALGIPVPGVEIRVEKSTARVWLERFEVEVEGPGGKGLGDRVRAVVERAGEVFVGFS